MNKFIRKENIAFFVLVISFFLASFFPTYFQLNKYTVSVLLLISTPLLMQYIKKAKWFGTEFDFKEHTSDVKKIIENNKAILTTNSETIAAFETFSVQVAEQIATNDPTLALAALQMELERVLTLAYNNLISNKDDNNLSLHRIVEYLYAEGFIDEVFRTTLHKIIRICNEAIHGGEVYYQEAQEVINVTRKLSEDVGIGFSINFKPNESYEKQGLLCKWEHCIENSPLLKEKTKSTCHIFGHECPGGKIDRVNCTIQK